MRRQPFACNRIALNLGFFALQLRRWTPSGPYKAGIWRSFTCDRTTRRDRTSTCRFLA